MSNEFTGLSLRYDTQDHGRDEYPMESLALAAIAAMKEEALQDYDAPLSGLDFVDIFHPENPIRLNLGAALGAANAKLTRSTVMWTLNALPVALMRARDMAYMQFGVRYRFRLLYWGVVAPRYVGTVSKQGQNQSALVHQPSKSPYSLAVIPTRSSKVVFQSSSSFKDHPHYDIEFVHLHGLVLPKLRVFESILGLLLRLGESDAASIINYVELASAEYQVWVYMAEVQPGARDHAFQQYHAVAILEAVARHIVLRGGQYREIAFKFLADGQQIGEGCLTGPVAARAWCDGLSTRSPLKPLSSSNLSLTTD